jgi:hypothetical protein
MRDNVDLKNTVYQKQKYAKRIPQPINEINQRDYLELFDNTQNDGIEEQCCPDWFDKVQAVIQSQEPENERSEIVRPQHSI